MSAPGQAKITLSAEDQTKAAFAAVGRNFAALQGQALGVKASFTAVAATVTATLAAIGASRKIELLDQLDKLQEKTGLSAEALSVLRYQGELANVPLEELAKGVQRLSKNMAEAAGGNKDAAATFAAMGISVKNADGSLKSQDAILGEIADKFAGYEDGAAKAALAQRIFGKSGADMIPLLNQGSEGLAKQRKEAQELGLILGGDLTHKAAEFNDNMTRLKLSAEAAAIAIGGPLIGSLDKLLRNYLEFKKEGLLGVIIKDAAKDVIGLGELTANAGADIRRLSAERDRLKEVIRGAQNDGLPTFKEEARLTDVVDLLGVAKVRQRNEALNGTGDTSDAISRRLGRVGKTAPPIADSGKGAAANALLRKILDGRLQDIKENFEDEKALLVFRQKVLDADQAQGLTSLSEFFDKQKALRQDSLAAQTREFDDEIADLREHLAKYRGTLKPEEIERINNDIGKLTRERARAVTEAGRAEETALRDNLRAWDQAVSRYNSILADIRELKGDSFGAAQLRIAAGIKADTEAFRAIGFDPEQASKMADDRARLLTDQAKSVELQQQIGRLTDQQRNAEERATLESQAAGESEYQLLQRITSIRQSALPEMEALVQKFQALAQESDNPNLKSFADNLATGLIRARVQVDPLMKKFRELGDEAAHTVGQGIEDWIVGAKSFKSALQDVEQQLLRMFTREFVTNPFENWLKGSFGGNQSSGGGGPFAWLMNAIGIGASPVTNIGATGATFAEELAAGVIPLATGTNYVPQDMLAVIHKGEAVVPKEFNKAGMGGATIHLVQNFAPGTTKATIDQAAQAAGIALQRALARNG